jgi:predicted ABC-type ATPase
MPQLFVITGANGAGKSTLSSTLLPPEIADLSVFDGDKYFVERLSEIFPSQNKSPKYAREMAFNATVEAFEGLVQNALTQNLSFAYEGHFSSEMPWQTIQRFRENKYQIIMVFMMVSDLSISQKRVIERVKTGGHYVTPREIEKNYYGNLIQLNLHLNLLDELIVIDNSKALEPNQITYISDKKCLQSPEILPDWLIQYLPNLKILIES